jgi:hypothetical protein
VKFIDRVWFVVKTKILVMTPLLVMLPSSVKPVLVLSFDFGLIGSGPSLVEIGESTVSFPTLCLKCVLHLWSMITPCDEG